MRVTIEKVSPGAEGIWSAQIEPQRLLKLANPCHQGGRINIIMIPRPLFDEQNHSLQFDLDSVLLLNLGNTSETILISSREDKKQTEEVQKSFQKRGSGDYLFYEKLKLLPKTQRKVGKKLLAEIRKEFPGELKFYEKSKKFVESPDNFWVVRVQPRAKSLRIIVYGKPIEHGIQHSIVLKPDMGSYSSFTIDSEDQLPEAIKVIRNAKRLKDRR